MSTEHTTPTVRIPRSALALLSHRCAAVGADGVRALREAGYRAGVTMSASVAQYPGELTVSRFWESMASAFETAGLGTVRFEGVSPSIGAISWTDSPEASGTRPDRPGARCFFAAGLLAGLLGQAAGKRVDVLEIRCGAGDRACWFLFGTVASMRAVREAAREASARLSGSGTTPAGASL